jgi:hypothetical protein
MMVALTWGCGLPCGADLGHLAASTLSTGVMLIWGSRVLPTWDYELHDDSVVMLKDGSELMFKNRAD